MVLASLVLFAGADAVLAQESGKPGIEPRERYLLLDKRLISSVDNAVLKLGVVERHPENPLLFDELPWEVDGFVYFDNVCFDPEEKIYKCWYYSRMDTISHRITPGPEATDQVGFRKGFAILYATSSDGIHWVKPKLNLYLYKGQPTNIVSWETREVGVTRDPYDPNPQRRYKMVSTPHEIPCGRLYTSFSADGIHWSAHYDTKITTSGDSHNHVFWNPLAREYVIISRGFSYGKMGYDLDMKSIPWLGGFAIGQRVVVRSVSKDFVKWSAPEIVFEYGHDLRQIYSMPSFYTHGVFLGLPAIYDNKEVVKEDLIEDKGWRRQKVTTELESELKDAGSSWRIWTGLAYSPDSKNWSWIDQRGKAMIPLSQDPESYEWGMIFAANAPVILDDEIRIYYSVDKWKHGGWHPGWLGLATLRADGWAGYEPEEDSEDGFVETQPILCSGQTLSLAADAENGSIGVTLIDVEGKILAVSKPLKGNEAYALVEWKNGFKLSAHQGQLIRLKFTIKRAKLYSFMFDE